MDGVFSALDAPRAASGSQYPDPGYSDTLPERVQGYERLRRGRDFRCVYSEGVSHRSTDVVVFILRTCTPAHRLGVVASRKVGNAVRRNRARRILREAHRRLVMRGGFTGLDVVLVARHGAPSRSSLEVEGQLEALYISAGLLPGRSPVGHE